MKASVSALILIFLVAGIKASKIERIDGSVVEEATLTKQIQSLMQSAQVTGLAIAVFNNNEVVYQKAFGYRSANTNDTLGIHSIFYGASLSKAVFSHLVMQLAQEDKIDLHRPLQDYLDKPLPEYQFNRDWRGYGDLKGDKRYEKLTARMCLSHTTGFPNWRFLTKSGFNLKGKLHFQFEPGTRYSYSGEGLALLQFVVEQITGKGLEELAKEEIFRPLEMDRSSYIYVMQKEFENQYVFGHDTNQQVIPFDQADEAGAAGSLGTTLADYSRFMEMVLQRQLLNERGYDEMFTQQIRITSEQQFGPKALVETTENRDINLGYGLGWGLLETPHGKGAFKEGHAEGFQHYSIIFPEKDIGVLIMTNSNNGEGIFKELLEISIADVYTPWKWENYIPYNVK